MTTIAFICALVSVVLFILAAFQVATSRVNLIALGLAFLGLSWIFQLTVSGSLVHL